MAGQESRIAPAFFVALIVLVTCVGATLDADLTQNRPGEVQRITSIEAFEKDVLTSSDVWVVVFTSTTKDEIKSRGVNREKCDQIVSQLTNAAIELNSVDVKVGFADIDDIGAIASEFNVRKRFLPVALLFKTRARDGEKLKAELFADPVALKASVEELLNENPRGPDGNYQKITLTLGGGEL